LAKALASLGIPPERIGARGLPLHTEADELVVVQTDADGREHRLTLQAAAAWHTMAEAARGVPLDEILSVTAPPGYSEHHTGRAVDVATPGTRRALETEFEETDAFAWLARNAGTFGWELSYQRGNPLGFAYEPWHWCWRGPDRG
jgi:D-alanyl-D-alanine carboxypeptidase